jgi:hypothetical protein
MLRGRAYLARVIDGEIVCACQDDPGPEECCWYPWPNPGDPLYPDTDLPESVRYVVEGSTLDTLYYVGGYRYEGTTYAISAYPPDGWEGEWITWRRSFIDDDSSVLGMFGCLIVDDFVDGVPVNIEDEFSETYQADFIYDEIPYSIALIRQEGEEGECDLWAGFEWPFEVQIRKDPDEYVNWEFEVLDVVTESFSAILPKSDPQSSPVGTYLSGAPALSAVTVS